MKAIEIDLPDTTAQAARDAGLPGSLAIEVLIEEGIRRQQAAHALLSMGERVAATGIPPMSMDEINADAQSVATNIRQLAVGLDAKVLVSGLLGHGPPRAFPHSRARTLRHE